MTTAARAETAGTRGRPRSAEADRAILRAVTDLLADVGYGGLTMEGVAVRAGVGKATLYRRWPSKSALVMNAIHACSAERFPLPDTGRVGDDLAAFMHAMVDLLRTSDAGRILPGLVAEFARSPGLAESFRRDFLQPRRTYVAEAVRRGIARGELRPDLDVELVVDATAAFFQYRLLVTGLAIDDDLPDRVLDLVLHGVVARPARRRARRRVTGGPQG